VDTTQHTKPKGMTHWSCRLMAARQGVSSFANVEELQPAIQVVQLILGHYTSLQPLASSL
jgi:hypothetical protein